MICHQHNYASATGDTCPCCERDADRETPHTKSDRNLPYAHIMTMAEIDAAEHQGPGGIQFFAPPAPLRKHSHYFKPCPFDEIDIYRVLQIFGVTDQAIGHAVKKLLVAGGRGAGKDISQDVKEAADTLARWQEMRAEETAS